MDFTFLITYYCQPDFLDICIDSIKKYYPKAKIVISQQIGDNPINVKHKVIKHDMHSNVWVDAAIGLAKECKTPIAIYIEHDAFLLRNVDDMLAKIRNNEYDLIGVEECIPFPGLERNAPGFANQNFFIINMKKMKKIGLEKMRADFTKDLNITNHESGYGISQSLDKKLFLPVSKSDYGLGTFYGDVCHHFWYGSFPRRNIEYDNINRLWIEEEADRLVNDYWQNKICVK